MTVLYLDLAADIDSDQRAALWRLCMALDSLEHGKVHDMLKPIPVENRPVDTLDIKCDRALAAAAMDALMQPVNGVKNKSEEQAAKYVARIVQKRKNPFGREVTWQKIRGWRHDLNKRANRADTDHDANLFHCFRAEFKKFPGSPERFAKAVLDMKPW